MSEPHDSTALAPLNFDELGALIEKVDFGYLPLLDFYYELMTRGVEREVEFINEKYLEAKTVLCHVKLRNKVFCGFIAFDIISKVLEDD